MQLEESRGLQVTEQLGIVCSRLKREDSYRILLGFFTPSSFNQMVVNRGKRQLVQTGFTVAVLLMTCWCRNTSGKELPPQLNLLLEKHCTECHSGDSPSADLDFHELSFALSEEDIRERWIRIYDRIHHGEMPPPQRAISRGERNQLTESIATALIKADESDIRVNGRTPMRRLTREEYEQNLRDLLKLPDLDIRDMLPEDREAHLFNRTSSVLDISRVQLTAFLKASRVALEQAAMQREHPHDIKKHRFEGTQLFTGRSTFGQRQAMFFAVDNRAVTNEYLDQPQENGQPELALFRSAHWPYYGYPQGFRAELAGTYQVRFSARAVLQQTEFVLTPATQPIPMTFRARKPSGPDVSGDVRATGGLIDIGPESRVFETKIRLLPRETFEYSLLGLPVPLARNVNGAAPSYRYPPFPEGGQPGVAFQWLEIEGPLAPTEWPPASHKVLFDQHGLQVKTDTPEAEAARLMERFLRQAQRAPLPAHVVSRYVDLVTMRIESGESVRDALLSGYQGFLSSTHYLFLEDPSSCPDLRQYAVAERLSHFLTSGPTDQQLQLPTSDDTSAIRQMLKSETSRLIDSPAFKRFVRSFTDYWLDLRHLKRNEPDFRLYPEYRFDNYLIESMERETQTFVRDMFRRNMPVSSVVDTQFVYVNDRLARHYSLPAVTGSEMQRMQLPATSPYGGLLTQAAVLRVTSDSATTSPVVRGAWVTERLLGQKPPPPPPGIAAVEPDIRGATSVRDLLEKHQADPTCAACHARFDPVGVALENFDVLGRWRTRYRALESGTAVTGIDPAGHDFRYTLTGSVDAAATLQDGRSFRNIHELKELLLTDERQLARNLLQQLVVYATGHPVRFSERREIEAMLDACQRDGYGVRDLLLQLVQSRIFLGDYGVTR